MKSTAKTKSGKVNYHPALRKSYKITRKLIKYGFYIALLYFSFEGFMAWK